MTDITVETMRERIVENVINLDRNSLGFETCFIFWNEDMAEWLMVYEDNEGLRRASYWADLQSHLNRVDDEEIRDWYEEFVADDYEELEAEQ